jgi:hypothetical protein
MPRTIRFEVPSDTSLFTPHQAQPRALLSLMMSGWARWIREHLVSFPRLVREHKVGVVVVGIHLEYVRPFGFFDGDSFDVVAGVGARKGGAQFDVSFDFTAGGATFARSLVLTRTVLLGDESSLAATPGRLPKDLLARFQPDELSETGTARIVPDAVKALEAGGPPLGTATDTFVVHRHLCEVADQWSFIDVPALAGEGREQLALSEGSKVAELRRGLSRPLKSIDVELGHPFYSFESGTRHSRVWADGDGLKCVHRLGSGDKIHATVIERL